MIFLFILVGIPVVLLIFLFFIKNKKSPNQMMKNPAKPTLDRSSVIKKKGEHYDEERKRILTMIDNGKISADDAEKLFNALERETTTMDCPCCGGEIRIESKKCKHCGEFFRDEFSSSQKRLTKSRDQLLCGVCGGVAEYLDVDVTLVRVLTVVVVLFSGILTGLVIYLIIALIIPDPE